MTRGYYAFIVAVLFAAVVPAFGQPPPETTQAPAPAAQAVPWSSLSADQKRLLGKVGGNWDSLPPERQQALVRGSDRWLGMSPEQRGQAQQRFQRWHALPPDQRGVLRDRWQKFQSLPPNQQSAVRQNFRRFQQLPPEKRQVLREQWRSASPAQRQRMIQNAREQRMRRSQMRGPAPHAPHPTPRPHR